MVTLGLSNNNIGSEGAAALAQALHFNYTLRTLLLRYACIMTRYRERRRSVRIKREPFGLAVTNSSTLVCCT